jgi:galactokinase
MYLSHEGLRDEYEVSCDELDLLFDIAKRSDDVLGARMMGGGFGGCTINIVKKEKTETFSKEIEKEYFSKTGTELKIYKVRIVDGTGLI